VSKEFELEQPMLNWRSLFKFDKNQFICWKNTTVNIHTYGLEVQNYQILLHWRLNYRLGGNESYRKNTKQNVF